MGTFNVYCRFPSNKLRFQITVTDVDGNVDSLCPEINRHIGLQDSDYDILYAGQRVNPDCKISTTFPQHNHSTLYVVPKFSSRNDDKPSEEPKVQTVGKQEMFMAIESALLNHNYKKIVERMLNDSDTVENLIASIPGLDKDPAVLAMLSNPDLLPFLAQPKYIDSILQKHPSFAQAAVTIATAVSEEAAKSGSGSNPGPNSYSLDHISDDEDEMPGPSRGQAGARNITASQLAAALQAATAGTGRVFDMGAPSSQNRSQPEPTPSGSGSSITSDFFQQAMHQAQASSTQAFPAPPPPQDMADGLHLLRDMGITDENVARQALTATNGDIQAAINLIFGDGMM